MNHLALYTFQCPVCGSPGEAGSVCEHLPPPADGHKGTDHVKREPVRVPGVGEEPRYTLEQVRAGLLSDGAKFAAEKARMQKEAEIRRLPTPRLTGPPSTAAALEAALDHFTQQPVGVGADAGERSSHEAGGAGENSPVSADSTGSKVGERVERMREAGDRHSAAAHSAATHLRNAVQETEGGDADGRKPVRETRRHVAEGDSVLCDGVALAQLLPHWVATLEHEAQTHEKNAAEWKRIGLDKDPQVAPHIKACDAHAATLRVIAAFLTQQSSGGQEGEDSRPFTPDEAKLLKGYLEGTVRTTQNRESREMMDTIYRKVCALAVQEGGVEEGADRRG